MTKQLGKTLTALGESPDRRGLDKLQTLNLTQPIAHDSHSKPNKVESHETGDLGLKNGRYKITANDIQVTFSLHGFAGYPGKNGVDGKTYRVSTSQYYANDVASETCVVDGIGQRLELKIENIRGGGGQRRISLYCPFWIVVSTPRSIFVAALAYLMVNSLFMFFTLSEHHRTCASLQARQNETFCQRNHS